MSAFQKSFECYRDVDCEKNFEEKQVYEYSDPYIFFCKNVKNTASWKIEGHSMIKINKYLIDNGKINPNNKKAYKILKTLITKGRVTIESADHSYFYNGEYTYVLK